MTPLAAFCDLWESWQWEPIPRCEGRFKLVTVKRRLPISALVGDITAVAIHSVPTARDQGLVLELKDGGIISYLRSDGTVLHTLNTSLGFDRKLCQLGIGVSAGTDRTV